MSNSIELQVKLDDLALRLGGDDQLLVWKARSKIAEQAEIIARIRRAANDTP